ncbi:MAG: hypothetical protein ACK5ME_09360, partial [Parahaliea sp.]
VDSWRAGELDAATVKRTNIVIHGLAALLLFFFLRSLLLALYERGEYGRQGAWRGCLVLGDTKTAELLALAAALFWLVHPLQVSTVLYAVQRMAQLSALFVFAGLYYFTARRRLWVQRGASLGELLTAVLWMGLITLLAVLSKENGALLPWLVLVVEVCIFRGRWAGRDNALLARLSWLLLVLPLLLAALLWLFAPELINAGYASRDFTLQERLLTEGRILWISLSWLLLPSVGARGSHHDDIMVSTSLLAPPWPLLAWLGWTGLLVLAWRLRQQQPLLLFAVLFFLVGHSMESGFLPLEMAFEHRNYLPAAGLGMGLAALLSALLQVPERAVGKVAAGVCVILYCFLLGLTFIRVTTWQDEVRMAQVGAFNHPASVRAHAQYAKILLERAENASGTVHYSLEARTQMLAQARQHYELMYDINPQDFGAMVMMYQLDSRYVDEPGLADGWLAQILEVLPGHKMSASDASALGVLLNCLGKGVCRAPAGTAEQIMALLNQRYPHSARFMLLYYQYLLARSADSDERLAYLQQAHTRAPGSAALVSWLMSEQAERGNIAQVLALARQTMVMDPERRSIGKLQKLFMSAGAESKGEGAEP